MPKEDDILNACGHRNSERVKALKELPSAVCPACLLERITDLEKAVEEWRNKADSELDINAKIHTATAGLESEIITMNDKCVKTRRGLEQKNRLLRIDLAEALEYCIGVDIEAATKRLEEALN